MKFTKGLEMKPAEMQLAPMVDMVFLLLIFFIATSSLRDAERELEIKVPVADQAQDKPQSVGQLVVNVRQDGTLILEGREISEDDLLARMTAISEVFDEQAVIIRADGKADSQTLVDVVNTCAKAGIYNVTLASTQMEGE